MGESGLAALLAGMAILDREGGEGQLFLELISCLTNTQDKHTRGFVYHHVPIFTFTLGAIVLKRCFKPH